MIAHQANERILRAVQEAMEMPWGKFAILDDTCGNLVQLQQVTVKY